MHLLLSLKCSYGDIPPRFDPPEEAIAEHGDHGMREGLVDPEVVPDLGRGEALRTHRVIIFVTSARSRAG
jgi:hypothetical protein